MVTPKDAAIVRALAMLHVDDLVRESPKPVPYRWRDEMKHELARAIDLAIQDTLDKFDARLSE